MIDPKLLRIMAKNLEKLADMVELSKSSPVVPLSEILTGGITEEFLESLGFVPIDKYNKLKEKVEKLEKELEKRDKFINDYLKNELSPWENLAKLYRTYGEMTEKILEYFQKNK